MSQRDHSIPSAPSKGITGTTWEIFEDKFDAQERTNDNIKYMKKEHDTILAMLNYMNDSSNNEKLLGDFDKLDVYALTETMKRHALYIDYVIQDKMPSLFRPCKLMLNQVFMLVDMLMVRNKLKNMCKIDQMFADNQAMINCMIKMDMAVQDFTSVSSTLVVKEVVPTKQQTGLNETKGIVSHARTIDDGDNVNH